MLVAQSRAVFFCFFVKNLFLKVQHLDKPCKLVHPNRKCFHLTRHSPDAPPITPPSIVTLNSSPHALTLLCAQTNLKAILSMVPDTATALVKGVLRNAHDNDEGSQLLALEFYKHLRPCAV